MTAVGGLEDPAARTEVALTYFHTACDTALVDSILFFSTTIEFEDAVFIVKKLSQTPKVKGHGG